MDIFDDEIFDSDDFKLVVAIVERGFGDDAINAAKSAGAKGGVVLSGKGSGTSQRKFFGMSVAPENDIVLILVNADIVVPIMKAIYASSNYKAGQRGFVFALPVSYVTGMTHIKELDEN
ncbi:MAG: hypothetical protein IJS74_01330 [Clostridia bacterium]|nr:hypothetical protein [Clostridia bacterium]